MQLVLQLLAFLAKRAPFRDNNALSGITPMIWVNKDIGLRSLVNMLSVKETDQYLVLRGDFIRFR